MAFSPAFEKALKEWKQTRPEFKLLVEAVRRRASKSELVELAADAGCDWNEMSDLLTVRERGTRPSLVAAASRFEAAQAELTEVLTQIQGLEKKLALAKSRMQENEIEGRLYDTQERRQRVMLALAEARIGKEAVLRAKEMGVI